MYTFISCTERRFPLGQVTLILGLAQYHSAGHKINMHSGEIVKKAGEFLPSLGSEHGTACCYLTSLADWIQRENVCLRSKYGVFLHILSPFKTAHVFA